jgi:hypothetical protein
MVSIYIYHVYSISRKAYWFGSIRECRHMEQKLYINGAILILPLGSEELHCKYM